MPTFTIQALIDRAASISDMHDDFITPKEWLAWYNTERVALQYSLASQGAALQDLQMDTTPAMNVFQLTGQVLAIVGVWEVLPSTRLREVRIVNFADNVRQLTSQTTGAAQYVMVDTETTVGTEATNFRFFPVPTTGEYLIVTLKAPDKANIVNDTTTIPMGLEERIVLGMAERALIKEESDTSEIRRKIQQMDEMVEQYAYKKVFTQAPTIRNVDRRERGWLDDVFCVNPDTWFWR